MNVTLHGTVLAGAAAALLACGDSAPSSRFPAASRLAARCATPRPGTADRQGTVADEKAWVRSWTDELYLWYREVPSLDDSTYPGPEPYFEVLKTKAVTASGRPKDQFHFTYPSAAWTSLIQSGVDVGYGLQWALLSPTVPREVVVAYVQPNTPATDSDIGRGFRLLFADGADVVNGTGADAVAAINAALSPAAAGETHAFVFQDTTGATVTATLAAGAYATAPVQHVRTLEPGDGLGPVGYFAFHDHVATAEAALYDAVTSLKASGVADLVVDLRYNGGGFLEIASELAYMIAGPAATTGKTFERTVFNDKNAGKDPITGDPLAALRFASTTQGFSLVSGKPLPSLGLGRVFLLTGPGTCSASESIINSLQGVDVQVVQIGSTTCGKPYGFYPQDNCGTTYFAIEFQGVNAKGFGDYADGFTPGGAGGASPPGCVVADDFAHDLGDPAEARLAAALSYRATGSCPAPSTAVSRRALVLRRGTAEDPVVPKSPLLTNRIVRR